MYMVHNLILYNIWNMYRYNGRHISILETIRACSGLG